MLLHKAAFLSLCFFLPLLLFGFTLGPSAPAPPFSS